MKKEKKEESKKENANDMNGKDEEETKISEMKSSKVRIFDNKQRAEIEEIKESEEFNKFQLD